MGSEVKKKEKLLVFRPRNLTVDIRKKRLCLQVWAQGTSLLLQEEDSGSAFPVPPTAHCKGEDFVSGLQQQALHMDLRISKATVKLETTL